METQNKKIIYIVGSVIVLCLIFAVFFYYQNDFQRDNKKEEITVIEVDPEIKKKTEEQLPKIKEDVAQHPTSSEVVQMLARAEFRMGNIANAQEAIEKAIEINNNDPRYYVDFGNILKGKNDLDGAENQYKKAIDLVKEAKEIKIPDQYKNVPQDMLPQEFRVGNLRNIIPTPFVALARMYGEQKKSDEAIKVLEEGVQYVPAYPDFYLMLSELYTNRDLAKATIYRKQFEGLIK